VRRFSDLIPIALTDLGGWMQDFFCMTDDCSPSG